MATDGDQPRKRVSKSTKKRAAAEAAKQAAGGSTSGAKLLMWTVLLCFLAGGSWLYMGGHSSSSQGGAPGEKKASTAELLEFTKRVSVLAMEASAMSADGSLHESGQELQAELDEIEAAISAMPQDSRTRDVLAIVSVVRGTTMKISGAALESNAEKKAFTYAEPEYWDGYYNQTGGAETYDWYVPGGWRSQIDFQDVTDVASGDVASGPQHGELGDILRPFLAEQSKILMLGCGNSEMSEQMYTAGFRNIVNVDISRKLLESLRERLARRMPEMQWVYANASELSFADHSFDVVLDKGTLDALEHNAPLRQAAVRESHRTLQPGGTFLTITFAPAATRVAKHLQSGAEWASCRSFAFTGKDPKDAHFVHACRRPLD